jgi:hypothetical protein
VRAQIIILSGPPGAEKSTVAPLLADHFDRSVILPMDELFHFIRRGHIAPFLPDAAQQNEVVSGLLAAAAARYASGATRSSSTASSGPGFSLSISKQRGVLLLSQQRRRPMSQADRAVTPCSIFEGHGRSPLGQHLLFRSRLRGPATTLDRFRDTRLRKLFERLV